MRDDFNATDRMPEPMSLGVTTYESMPTVARGPITPPSLHAIDSLATQLLPRATVANLRLPAELVQRRTAELAEYARSGGAQHSLRLWRGAHEQALLSLVREATGTPETFPCEALFWEQRDGDFCVSATFGRPTVPLLH